MRRYLSILFLIINITINSQITDTIFGKPKYVKEYVEFLTEKENYKFMEFDSDYGHAVIETPSNLANLFKTRWYETYFCGFINNETYFDEKRNILKQIWYRKSGELDSYYQYKFDIKNRLISELDSTSNSVYYQKIIYDDFYRTKNTFRYNKSSDYFHTFFEKLDTLGKVIYKSFLDDMGFYNQLKYKYNDRNKLIQIYKIDSDRHKRIDERTTSYGPDSIGNRYVSNKFFYNVNGKLIKEMFFSPKDPTNVATLNKEVNYRYDSKSNNLLEIETVYPISDTKSITKFHYNNKGQKIEKSIYTKEQKLVYSLNYKYKNAYIEELIYREPKFKEIKEKKYLIKFKYKFDKHKNWTEIIKNVDGKDLYVWKREIEYY